MTSRERVLRTLEFAGPDRAPRDLWALPWVGMFMPEQQADMLNEFPPDFAWPGAVLAPGERRTGRECRKGSYTDDWGCVWECAEDGVIGEVRHPPLADWSALGSFRPPWEILERADWDQVARAQQANLAGSRKFMLCSGGIRPFERMQFLRGTENLMLDLAEDASPLRQLLAMVHEFNLCELDGWAKTPADGVVFMDDWGSQRSLLISPAMWREFFKPLYREYCRRIHAAGKKVFFHSDGNIFSIYEDLIEIGVDAVNSQLFCMDIEELGRRYKGRITFWGEIDRQHILPRGTVHDARAAVGRVRRALGSPSGGVIAQMEWGPGVPIENLRAVYQAWQEPLEQLP